MPQNLLQKTPAAATPFSLTLSIVGLSMIALAVIGLPNKFVIAEESKPFSERPQNFQVDELVAWCIVPFDASQRGPAERAQMIADLGMSKIAYDWRQQHVSEFAAEIEEYKKRQLEFFAFWSWHDDFAQLASEKNIAPQFWITNPSPNGETQAERVAAATQQLLPLVRKAEAIGGRLGLYNHGGWGGEPENLVAVCKSLRAETQNDSVGIVYNFHHGHEHIDDFADALNAMLPYLFCLNLNGMADSEDVNGLENKILPIGSGKHERKMIQAILESGYDGPIGVLDHRSELDARESLQQNLDGLDELFSKQ
ncbi:sugar phosphate isomerase/epimerase family protein [Thalassoglobus neptunius]|nr:TIM barrel protein [Thalassoglobus neptunius]